MIDELHARKLEPCPFCGNREVGIVEFVDGEGDRLFAVGCTGCGCNGAPHIPLKDDARPAAIASWNRRAAPEWRPIETAPKNERVRVRCDTGGTYEAHWVQNPVTGDEAWLVCAMEDGTQMLVHPVEWMPLPAAARPQGVK